MRVPATASAGEVIEIRTLIDHPMETGLRKGADGNLIPRDMLAGFAAMANGAEVFSAVFRNATSAHPYLVFHARIDGPTTFTFVWTHEDGRTVQATTTVAVTRPHRLARPVATCPARRTSRRTLASSAALRTLQRRGCCGTAPAGWRTEETHAADNINRPCRHALRLTTVV